MVTIVVFSDEQKPVTKLMAMSDRGHDRTGRGRRRLGGGLLGSLFLAHSGQAATYSFTSLPIDGHQKCCWTTN